MADFSAGSEHVLPSVVESLMEREQGANSGTVAYRPREVGKRGKRWISVLNGRWEKNLTSLANFMAFVCWIETGPGGIDLEPLHLVTNMSSTRENLQATS